MEESHTVTLGPQLSINHASKKVSGATIHIDQQGVRHLSWHEAGKERHELFYVAVEHNEITIPPAVHGNKDKPPVWAIHQSPGLALGTKARGHLSWTSPLTQQSKNPLASLLRLSTSLDKGQVLGAPITVNDDASPTSHTFDNLYVGPNGTVRFAWIDERAQDLCHPLTRSRNDRRQKPAIKREYIRLLLYSLNHRTGWDGLRDLATISEWGIQGNHRHTLQRSGKNLLTPYGRSGMINGAFLAALIDQPR